MIDVLEERYAVDEVDEVDIMDGVASINENGRIFWFSKNVSLAGCKPGVEPIHPNRITIHF